MTPTTIHIVCGPQGCGKTRNAERFRKFFRAETVMDISGSAYSDFSNTILNVAQGKPQTAVMLTSVSAVDIDTYRKRLVTRRKTDELMAGVTISVYEFDHLIATMTDMGIPISDDEPDLDDLMASMEKAESVGDFSYGLPADLPPGVYAAPGSRVEAQELVDRIRADFDLIDDAAMLRNLVEQMEERHSEAFETFYEVVITRFLEATGLKEVTFNTQNLFADLASPRQIEITAGPGTITYRLPPDDNPVD